MKFILKLTLGGDLLCRFVKYSQIMTLYLSTYILMFMAIDRYRAVCYGQIQWKSLKVAKSFVLSSYIISFVLAIPQAVIFHEEEVAQGVTDCWVKEKKSYFINNIFRVFNPSINNLGEFYRTMGCKSVCFVVCLFDICFSANRNWNLLWNNLSADLDI